MIDYAVTIYGGTSDNDGCSPYYLNEYDTLAEIVGLAFRNGAHTVSLYSSVDGSLSLHWDRDFVKTAPGTTVLGYEVGSTRPGGWRPWTTQDRVEDDDDFVIELRELAASQDAALAAYIEANGGSIGVDA